MKLLYRLHMRQFIRAVTKSLTKMITYIIFGDFLAYTKRDGGISEVIKYI